MDKRLAEQKPSFRDSREAGNDSLPLLQLALASLLAILTICSLVQLQLANTFNSIAAMLYAAILTSPAYAVILLVLRGLIGWLSPWGTRKIAASLILLVIAIGANGLALNKWLDRSAPDERTYLIEDKSISNSRSGPSHVASFVNDMPPPLPFQMLLLSREGVGLRWSEYDRVIPGTTRITLRVHKGAFGLPWFERAYTLSDLADASRLRGSAAD